MSAHATLPARGPRAATPAAVEPSAALDAAVEAALHDQARLREIHDLGLLSEEVDAILQAEAREAAEHFGLPIGLVSVVLDDTQYFAAQHGLGDWLAEQRGTPVEWSFCRFAVATKEAFVVENAAEHALVRDNPLTEFEGIRCYAGIPMVSSRGHALGSFCVIGPTERSFSADDMAELRRRAARAVARIEARRAG
jgi:GAF domain-containing protein